MIFRPIDKPTRRDGLGEYFVAPIETGGLVPEGKMLTCEKPLSHSGFWLSVRSALEAEAMFRKVRWPETGGAPVCPHCGGLNAYECRRPNGLLRFRCRACLEDFTITSGTLFAFHKLPLRGYLAAIAIFCNEVKGKSALAISRDLGLSYKAAFVLLHKLREAMAEEMKGRKLGGEGIVAEVDGGYFGGYVKPANHRENRRDRRLARNQNGKRKAVVIIRERNGRSLPAVFRSAVMHCVMETEAFARQAATVGLTEDERLEIAVRLSEEPTRGEMIPGTGGARKFRFPKAGTGKRIGYRVISYFAGQDIPVFLLDVLDKGDRLNLSQSEKNQLKRVLGRIADDYRKAEKERVRLLSEIAS